jgi:DNA-binding MarR family transcriptional regulator
MSSMSTDSNPRWLDHKEMRAWRAFMGTIDDLVAALDADLAPTDLSLGDYQVLVYLSDSPDRRLRMCDLALNLHLSPSGLTRRLDGLVQAGLVSREPSTEDRRVMLAVLTDDGMRTLEAAAPVHVESVRRRIFDHLDPEQVDAMAGIFDRIHRAVARAPVAPVEV